MNDNDRIRRLARAMNAEPLAHQAGVDVTELRRWLAGGVNVNVAAAVAAVLENKT